MIGAKITQLASLIRTTETKSLSYASDHKLQSELGDRRWLTKTVIERYGIACYVPQVSLGRLDVSLAMQMSKKGKNQDKRKPRRCTPISDPNDRFCSDPRGHHPCFRVHADRQRTFDDSKTNEPLLGRVHKGGQEEAEELRQRFIVVSCPDSLSL